MFTYKQCYPVTSVPCEMTQGFAGSFMLAAPRRGRAAYKCRSRQERLNLHACLPSTANKTPGWWGWTQTHVEPWLAFLLCPSSLTDMVIEHLTKIMSGEKDCFLAHGCGGDTLRHSEELCVMWVWGWLSTQKAERRNGKSDQDIRSQSPPLVTRFFIKATDSRAFPNTLPNLEPTVQHMSL